MSTRDMSKSLPLAEVVPVMSDFRLASRVRADMDVFLPSLTRQEFAEECDINTLMERYEKSGVISHVNRAQPVYMDMTVIPELGDALMLMRDAGIAFAALPAVVRREFDNDPVKFVEYGQNPDNVDRMREWGLAPPVAAPAEPMLVHRRSRPGRPFGAPKAHLLPRCKCAT